MKEKMYKMVEESWFYVLIAVLIGMSVLTFLSVGHKPRPIPVNRSIDVIEKEYYTIKNPVKTSIVVDEVVHVEGAITSKRYNDTIDIVGVKQKDSDEIYILPLMDLDDISVGDTLNMEITHITHDDKNNIEYIFARKIN